MSRFYLLTCMAGFVLPYAALGMWLYESGSAASIWSQIVENKLSLMAWLDVIITAVAVIAFVRVDARRNNVSSTLAPILGTCLVGPSFGLPLYLHIREKSRSQQRATG